MVQISDNFAKNVLKILKNDAQNTKNLTYAKVLDRMYDRLYDKINKRQALSQAKHALQLISNRTSYPQTRQYIMSKPALKRYLDYVDTKRYYKMLREVEADDLKHDRQDRIVNDANSLKKIKNSDNDLFYVGNKVKDADNDRRNANNVKSDLKQFLHKIF